MAFACFCTALSYFGPTPSRFLAVTALAAIGSPGKSFGDPSKQTSKPSGSDRMTWEPRSKWPSSSIFATWSPTLPSATKLWTDHSPIHSKRTNPKDVLKEKIVKDSSVMSVSYKLYFRLACKCQRQGRARPSGSSLWLRSCHPPGYEPGGNPQMQN